MRYGIEAVTLGPYADARRVVELAVVAEEAGFEMVAVWDHLAFAWGVPSGDPLVTLSAVAQATDRVRLLPFVMPLPRYRPHMLAFQLAALDRLSGGRLVVGVGLGGVPEEFAPFGDPTDIRERAARTDEGLAVMSRLWSGERVDHRGRYYRVEGVTLDPLPEQRPRPPVWIGGHSPAGLRRAARWDGWGRTGVGEDGRMVTSPVDLSRDRIRPGRARRTDRPRLRCRHIRGVTWARSNGSGCLPRGGCHVVAGDAVAESRQRGRDARPCARRTAGLSARLAGDRC